MQYKEVEELLREYKYNIARVKAIAKEIEAVDSECGLSGVSYDSTGGGGGISDTTHDTVAIRIYKKDKLKRERDLLEEKISIVEDGLKTLNYKERYILKEYYINNRKWWEVAEKVRYSEVHCRRIRKKAINKIIEKMFDF